MTAHALNIADIVEHALAMPRPERSYIVTKLIGSLDDDDEIKVSQEWRDEINRRDEEMSNGTLPGIPHDEVMSGAHELLAKIQREKQAA
jgi:putative addiction module component (TIGR02574 family)